jgi:chromate transporter
LILGAGIIGWVVGKWRPHWLIAHDNAANGMSPHAPTVALQLTDNAWRRTARVLAVSLVLWWLPVLLLALWLGREHTLVQQGIFFSKAALVTFGGAYAVLPYVAKQAVEQFGWLSAGQMLDGLGLAETTPGPLIMVLQFVGFLGGWQHPGALAPWLAATLGAAITTWTTFVPCFLWIFLGAPYLEQLRNWSQVRQALTAVTSAVVGVVLNLAVWFGGHVLLPERQLNLFGAAVAVATFAAMARSKVEVVPIVFGAALAGLLRHWLF